MSIEIFNRKRDRSPHELKKIAISYERKWLFLKRSINLIHLHDYLNVGNSSL